MPVSADTLLRRAKNKALALPTPRVLGVDDFAFRRGHTYGTILINLETHQPVDLLEDRRTETFANWLRQHPGVEIISRDRSKDYQRGATDGAPQAQQVIDRWHLLKNLREAIERFLSHTQMPEEASEDGRLAISPRQKRTSGERVRSEGSRKLRLALYQQVNELYRQGGTILGIARQLHIGHRRVRNFVRSPSFPEWGKPARTRSAIDPYRPYLQERWQQGCHATSQLWHELQERGFSGSWMTVYRWVQLQGDGKTEAQPPTTSPDPHMAPRHLAWLFLRHPEHLEKQEQQTLSLIRQEKNVEIVYGLSQQFVTMVKERQAHLVDTWLRDCQMSGITDLVTFAQGLEKEASALHAALTLPYSNGPVEGKINKLKYIKRSMYGRSGFPLLRQKVLKAA
jgi:transposase